LVISGSLARAVLGFRVFGFAGDVFKVLLLAISHQPESRRLARAQLSQDQLNSLFHHTDRVPLALDQFGGLGVHRHHAQLIKIADDEIAQALYVLFGGGLEVRGGH